MDSFLSVNIFIKRRKGYWLIKRYYKSFSLRLWRRLVCQGYTRSLFYWITRLLQTKPRTCHPLLRDIYATLYYVMFSSYSTTWHLKHTLLRDIYATLNYATPTPHSTTWRQRHNLLRDVKATLNYATSTSHSTTWR